MPKYSLELDIQYSGKESIFVRFRKVEKRHQEVVCSYGWYYFVCNPDGFIIQYPAWLRLNSYGIYRKLLTKAGFKL